MEPEQYILTLISRDAPVLSWHRKSVEKALLRDPFSWVAGGQAESMAAQRAAMLHRVGYLLHREPTRAQLFAKLQQFSE